jgi:hypothetical protein
MEGKVMMSTKRMSEKARFNQTIAKLPNSDHTMANLRMFLRENGFNPRDRKYS